MVSLNDMALQGVPWRVTADLSVASQDIVIPKPARSITNPHQQYATHESVTILGWAISALGGTSPSVTLRSLDNAIVEGTTTNDDIHVYRWANTSHINEAVTPAFITLRGATYQPTPANGSTLRIVTSDVASGSLCIWGIFGSSDLQSIYSVTGSPVDRSGLI